MPDRENVVKGLECCANDDEAGCRCKECPYGTNEYDTCNTIDYLLKDALKVLKEQETKTGKWLPCKASIYPYGYDVKCSECGLQMGSTFGYHFCPKCGAKMD